jgi:hypothetical protein
VVLVVLEGESDFGGGVGWLWLESRCGRRMSERTTLGPILRERAVYECKEETEPSNGNSQREKVRERESLLFNSQF